MVRGLFSYFDSHNDPQVQTYIQSGLSLFDFRDGKIVKHPFRKANRNKKLISNLRGEMSMVNEHQTANLFELSSDVIQVTYASSSIKVSPLLSYRDGDLNCHFSRAEIPLVMTE